jgi:hypothetical protein
MRALLLVLLVCTRVWAVGIIRESNGIHVFPDGISGPGVGVNAAQFGVVCDATTDNCQAYKAIDTFLGTQGNGGRVIFPVGECRSSCPLPLRQQSTYECSGAGGTILSTLTSGTGTALMQSRLPRTCATSGAGSCDAAVGTAGRGQGCVCYTNADCQSASCTGGTVQRNVRIEGCRFLLRIQNSTAIDLAGISESTVSFNFFSALSSTNTTDILLSDDAGAVAGYDNLLVGNFIQSAGIGVWIQNHANGTHLIGNTIDSNLIGLEIDTTTNATQIIGNNFQSDSTEDALDNGQFSAYSANRWENTASHLVIGASATNVSASAKDLHASSGAPLTNSGSRSVMDGLPFGATAPVACATTTPGISYYDTSPLPSNAPMLCYCNGQATPRYCRSDTGACGSSTTDCL